jgi:hypothetical protein
MHCEGDYVLYVIYALDLSRWLNSMKSSRAINRFRCLYCTDIPRTVSVIFIRDLTFEDHLSHHHHHYHHHHHQRSDVRSLLMVTEMVLETSVQCRHPTRLIVREDFIVSCMYVVNKRQYPGVTRDETGGTGYMKRAAELNELTNRSYWTDSTASYSILGPETRFSDVYLSHCSQILV